MRHITFKTVEEYVNFKFADTNPDLEFFQFNRKTKKKLDIIAQAPYNSLKDLVLEREEDFNEDMLNTYHHVYIKKCKNVRPCQGLTLK